MAGLPIAMSWSRSWQEGVLASWAGQSWMGQCIDCQADCCGEAEEGFVSQLGWAELVGTMH